MTEKRAVLRLVIGRVFVVSSERYVYCVGGAVLGKRSRFRGEHCGVLLAERSCARYVTGAVSDMCPVLC